MHEFSIVQSLVRELLNHLQSRGIEKVVSVRLRRGSTFSDEALHQSYLALSKGTILEGSELSVETVNLNFRCPCGHTQVITSDDLVGHMFVCPACGRVKEIDEAHDLELVDVVAEREGSHEHL